MEINHGYDLTGSTSPLKKVAKEVVVIGTLVPLRSMLHIGGSLKPIPCNKKIPTGHENEWITTYTFSFTNYDDSKFSRFLN